MNFRIRQFDTKNIVLEELLPGGIFPGKERGPDHWEIDGYFGKLEDLLKHLLNREIQIPEGNIELQIKGLLAEIKAAETRIIQEVIPHN